MKLRRIGFAMIPVAAIAAILVIPALSQAQNFGTISISSGFMPDPRIMNGTAGGTMSATAFGGGCRGYITPEPDHYMVLGSGFNFMRVFIRSGGDTTLIVRGPMPSMDTRCNDDRFGLNPAVEGSWTQGEYRLWVGSYSVGQTPSYQIGFTEMSDVH